MVHWSAVLAILQSRSMAGGCVGCVQLYWPNSADRVTSIGRSRTGSYCSNNGYSFRVHLAGCVVPRDSERIFGCGSVFRHRFCGTDRFEEMVFNIASWINDSKEPAEFVRRVKYWRTPVRAYFSSKVFLVRNNLSYPFIRYLFDLQPLVPTESNCHSYEWDIECIVIKRNATCHRHFEDTWNSLLRILKPNCFMAESYINLCETINR